MGKLLPHVKYSLKGVIFSYFMLTFAMPSWAARLCRLPQQELFVAQELITKLN